MLNWEDKPIRDREIDREYENLPIVCWLAIWIPAAALACLYVAQWMNWIK